MLKQLLITGAILSLTGLGACASLNGESGQSMSMVGVHKNPDYGPMTDTEYQVIVTHANSCLQDAKRQFSSAGESMVTGAVVNGIAGGGGGALSSVAVKGASAPMYAALIGVPNAFSGAAGGLTTHSLAIDVFVGSCTGGDLSDSKTRSMVPGVHAYPAYVRTSNGQRPPSWTTKGALDHPVEPAEDTPPPPNN